ncbi:hypothetical protein [Lignipirellula cremea]|uniref:Uncharacterized protein n=1 Tax=Lignipirellula cremea TaxID=2528010 RepID=A0A518DUF1_9BACT|nr:hypothetical protein [Lignipirellula cremea]QDU95465.1 hypothetical protein Pla8534_32800 [Lignipirellula cremea]
MTRRPRAENDGPGQDSFLDIVANLVGILIILVMIVGARAKTVMIEAQEATPVEVDSGPNRELEIARTTARRIEANIHELTEKQRIQQVHVQIKRQERDQLHLLLTAAEMELKNKQANLTQQQQDQYQQAQQLAAAKGRLEEVRRAQWLLDHSPTAPKTLEHIPTPIAQTVDNHEVHFRLLQGRLTYVPMDELQKQFQLDARQAVDRLRNIDEIVDTVGPIEGFRLKYTMVREKSVTPTSQGPVMREYAALDSYELIPVSDRLGAPLAEALLSGSQMNQVLADYKPELATVTVWVYPDSFTELRQLKRHLYERGYLTAARPLPLGVLIRGSRDGTKSVTQ